MPRSADTATEGVTRKRVTRRTTTATVRKRAATPRGSPRERTRKAPTPIASKQARISRYNRLSLVVAVFALGTIGASIGIGMADEGTIDPSAIIEARNERVAQGESVPTDVGGSTETIPVRSTSDARPNGGGVGMGDLDEPAPPAPTPTTTASSSATSTAQAATSTDPATASAAAVAGTSTATSEDN